MTAELAALIESLSVNHSLSLEEYRRLLELRCPEGAARLAERAVQVRKELYGNAVYVRGLIEISSFCKNDCLYCGIRRSNPNCGRYRLTPEQILSCADEGYALGLRTFVLQGGEDAFFTLRIDVTSIRQYEMTSPLVAVFRITAVFTHQDNGLIRALQESGVISYYFTKFVFWIGISFAAAS